MTNYIPVELLKSPNAVSVLSMIDIVSHIIPQEDPTSFISNMNRSRMTRYNIQMLEKDLNSVDTFETELKKFHLVKKYSENITKARRDYMSYYKNKNRDYERLGAYKVIEGVGSDGGGLFPDNRAKENEAVSIIESDVERRGKWPIIGSMNNNSINPSRENDVLRQCIRGIIGWPSSNFGNLSLGSPCQMISAIIGFTSNPAQTINWKDFIKMRPECEGLKYLLEGNKLDMENMSYDGIRKFESTTFRNFFHAFGGGNAHNFIVLKCGPGISEIKPDGLATTGIAGKIPLTTKLTAAGQQPVSTLHSTLILSHTAQNPQNPKNLFYVNPTNPTNPFAIAETGMTNALIHLFKNETNDDEVIRKCRFGSIMLIYSMFYMYGLYIYNLYNKMIDDLKMTDALSGKYKSANLGMLNNLLDYINFMINKNFKINDSDPKDLIIVSTEEKTSFEDTKPISIQESNIIPDHSTAAAGQQHAAPRYQTELDSTPAKLKNARDRISFSELKGTVYVGFKKSSYYADPTNFISDADLFTKENYPIAFLNPETCDEIDYKETYKRLYKFLSIGTDDEPKIKDKIISLGAPLQNNEMVEYLSEVLDTYYSNVSNSRSIFLNYMDLKLNIFKSSVSASTIAKLRDELLKSFGLINMISQKELRDIKLIKLAKDVMVKYRGYRRDELKLTDDKTIYQTRNTVKNSKLDETVKEQARFMKKLKQGTYAIIQFEVSKLTHQLFMNKNPTSALGNIFIDTINTDVQEIDADMDKELRLLIARKTNNIIQKYGQNALKHISQNIHLLRFSDIPKTPATYLSSIHSLYTSISTGSRTVPSGIIGGPASGSSYPIQKSLLTAEQKMRVSSTQFWKDIRLSFNGKTLYLPAIKISTSRGATIFNDNNFYMIDVFNSMIQGRLITIRLYPLTPKTIYARLNRTGYLMLTAITSDLSNPDRWMAIDFRHFARMLKTDGSMGFRRIAQGRSDFFNLIANNGHLITMMNNSIPAISQISKVLTAYCAKVLKKDLSQCSLFVSQPQFAQNIQPKMEMFESTKSIDMRTGYSFFEYSVVGVQNTIQR